MKRNTPRKIALIGGGGVRTPLIVFGINEARHALGAEELVLYDLDQKRCHTMAELGNAILAEEGGSLRVRVASSMEDAVEGAWFVLNSIRAGGNQARAHDERVAIEHAYPGQETTGPGGVAMALRTVPIAVEQAKAIERFSPDAWLINFTNPAGLITQAIQHNSAAKVVGICDTPSEMMHRIRTALGEEEQGCRCEYLGLNHLGWVRRIWLRGEDVTERLLADDGFLDKVYPINFFDHELIRALKLLPTEYLFFYYSRRRALENQRKHGSTRGAEIETIEPGYARNPGAVTAARRCPRGGHVLQELPECAFGIVYEARRKCGLSADGDRRRTGPVSCGKRISSHCDRRHEGALRRRAEAHCGEHSQSWKH
jgi:6-phospho-beta-glucosidase